MKWIIAAVFGLLVTTSVQAQGIEGGRERMNFEPGDQVIFETDLAHCPVGEYPPAFRLLQGAFECARFRDQIWIRPLEKGTVLYLPLAEPLPAEFSLELTVWTAKDGCPFVEFRLHDGAMEKAFARREAYVWNRGALLGGSVGCAAESTAFGVSDAPGKLPFALRAAGISGDTHEIAVQVRRGQARFYVDGRLVSHRPFRPQAPLGLLSFYFFHRFATSTPYANAPAMVRKIRIASYSRQEAPPQAEQDLIAALGAKETPEGLKVTLSEAILFDLGAWRLKPEAMATLQKLAALAKLRKGAVRVEGHTDDLGPEQFNRVLSELRAHVVALALARLGVDPERLMPEGFGESRPVAPNDSDANRARNRRVEVILAKP